MAENGAERPDGFLIDCLEMLRSRRFLALFFAVVFIWVVGIAVWPPSFLIVPAVLIAAYIAGSAAFHYGLLPERAEWQVDPSTRQMRARTAKALGLTLFVVLPVLVLALFLIKVF